MKFWILIATIIFGVIGGCNKATLKYCVKGKILVNSCPNTVIQVLDNDALGEDGWIDFSTYDRILYDNVFDVNNKCDLPSNLNEGDIIWFNIDSPIGTNCRVCNAYVAAPKKLYNVSNVSSSPCPPN